MTDPRTFTESEILQILNDARSDASRRLTYHIISDEEEKGHSAAIMNVAKRFGVEMEKAYVNNTLPIAAGE